MINEQIVLGKLNRLRIDRDSPHGFFLMSEDENSVLLPQKFKPAGAKIGDEITVFIYTDSEDRLVATSKFPFAMKDEFAVVIVKDIVKFGAFVDIGLEKDLLVPKNKQKTPFKVGEKRIVRIVQDDKSNRLIGVEKITNYLNNNTSKYQNGDEVDILVFVKTPMGFKVIVNNAHEAMIFANEIFDHVFVGQKRKAYIKRVREDGKLDLILTPPHSKGSDSECEKFLEILKQNNNTLPLTSKSDPELIKKYFGISKKAFKASLNKLIGEGKIEQSESDIKIK